MATKDFSSKQIRVSQLLASGGISGTTAGMAIYSASNASNLEGGISDGAIFNNVGSDVFLFVSGTANITNSNRSNVTLFGGDVVVSGTIYAERQVIEVDETTTGSLLVSGSLFVSRSATINQGLNVNNSLSNVETNIFNRFGSAIKVSSGPFDEIVVNEEGSRTSFRVESDTKTHAVFVQGTTGQVLILSGGAPASPDELNYSDTAFFVSGSVGSKDTTTRGTSVFGGDVVISGALHGGSPLQIGEHRNDLGTDVELFVSGNNGGINVSGVSLFGGDVAFSGSIYPAGTTETLNIGSADQSYLGVYSQEFYGDLEGAIRFNARNDEGDTIQKGQAVYIKGISGQTPTVGLAACDDPNKMPAFGLAGETVSNGGDFQVVTFGDLSNINLNSLYVGSFTEGDVLYVSTGSNYTSGSLTNIRPKGGSNLLQNMGFVVRDGGGSDGRIKVGGAGRSNATPNLNEGQIFIGDSTNCSSTASLSLNLAYASGSGAIIGVDGQPVQLQAGSNVGLAVTGSVLFGNTTSEFSNGLPPIGTDTNFLVSGSAYDASAGSFDPNNFGEVSGKISQFGGDVIVSGAIVGKNDSLSGISGETNNLFLAAENSIYGTATSFGFYGDVANLQDVGSDMFYFVSGTIGGKGTEGVAVFGGDLHVSGAITADGGSPAPTYRYEYVKGLLTVSTSDQYIYVYDTGGSNNPNILQGKYTAPASGSIERIIMSPVQTSTPGTDGQQIITYFTRNSIQSAGTVAAIEGIVTGSSDISYTLQGTTVYKSIIDWTGSTLTVSGSNSFDPGDLLYFGIKSGTAGTGDVGIQIVLKFDESVTYP